MAGVKDILRSYTQRDGAQIFRFYSPLTINYSWERDGENVWRGSRRNRQICLSFDSIKNNCLEINKEVVVGNMYMDFKIERNKKQQVSI